MHRADIEALEKIERVKIASGDVVLLYTGRWKRRATCKHGVRRLLESEGGAVVCTASPTGLYGVAPGEDAYSASKAGVYGLIRVMANDYALRAIPFAALHDGRGFLRERYATAIAPALHLTEPRPLYSAPSTALVLGISKSVQGFAELPKPGLGG